NGIRAIQATIETGDGGPRGCAADETERASSRAATHRRENLEDEAREREAGAARPAGKASRTDDRGARHRRLPGRSRGQQSQPENPAMASDRARALTHLPGGRTG